MRWFKRKPTEAEEIETFRTNLAKKLEGYESTGRVSNFSATDCVPVDPYDTLHGEGIDADPRWIDKPEAYVVEELDLTDLSESELETVARLRQAYVANLHTRELQADPDTQKFNNIIRGDDEYCNDK